LSKTIKLQYTKANILRGAIIYSSGDLIASLLLGEFSMYRLVGMIVLGATLYALEIPNYFAWIEVKTKDITGTKNSMDRSSFVVY